MSKPIRIAFVVEGSTDYIVLRAAIRSLLKGRDFVPTNIWPELDTNLRPVTGGGWGAVYKWCLDIVEQAGGSARENPLFVLNNVDMVVIQVDADVARKKYKNYDWIKNPPDDELFRGTCEKPCPKPNATTNALRTVVLGWMNETSAPPKTVFCTPSKNTETWVLVGLFPDDDSAKKPDIECRWDGEVRLRTHGLIKSGQKLIDKYLDNEDALEAAWPAVRAKCSEAERFSADFLSLVPTK
jgi:hypothetical protein